MLQTSRRIPSPARDLTGEHANPINHISVLSHKWWYRKKVIVLPLILLGIILGAVLFGPLRWTVGLGAQTAGIRASGELQSPVYNLNFSPVVSGTISEIYVSLGQYVVANQALARLGQHTYVAQLQQAQVAVDASRNVLKATQRFVLSEIRFVHSTVVLTTTVYQAELNNRQALIQQANANIAFARVTLATDQAALRAIKAAAQASIKAAKETLNTALASCLTAAATSTPTSSPTPTPTATATPTSISTSTPTSSSTLAVAATPTGSPTPTPTATAIPTSISTSTPTSSPTQTSCVQAAEATYQAAVAAANVTVVEAQGAVQRDQAALTQAKANANVSLVAENGLINIASAGITVAENDPDIAGAYLSLAAAENTYRVALAALLVAQQTLDLTTLRAPHSGVVSIIIGTVGNQPGGGSISSPPFGSAFIQIVDTTTINTVEAYVDDADIQKIHVGQAARFTLKANPSQQFSGSISAISPNGFGFSTTAMPADTKFEIIIAIGNQSNTRPKLYSGMTGTVSITP